ncbi:MAG: DNA internalization-related competence protein ComEC/Rec2 [Thermodesulfobacteriota bacterium]|nr:DNA internalization-related competence protein ComEC/Rec2 [Thermodesulfobacteriota bacterium]
MKHEQRSNVSNSFHFPIIPLVFAFISGILAGKAVPMHPGILYAGAGVCLLRVGIAAVKDRSLWVSPLLLLFFLGWLSISVYVPHVYPDNHLAAIVQNTDRETWWKISGTVDSRPEISGRRQVLLLDVETLSNKNKQIEDPEGRLRVSVYDRETPVPFGATMTFAGRIRPIRNFRNPGGFDYEQYMAFRNVFGHAYTSNRRTVIHPQDSPFGLKHRIEAARTAVAHSIDANTGNPQAGILKALVVGLKKDIPPPVREAFNRSGVAHLLAISGLHVGIVAGVAYVLFFRLLGWVPALLWGAWVRKGAALIALICVAGYGLIAGMSPATQRAVIMVSVFLIAIVIERDHSLMNTLALAALVILIVDPPALFSVSFQLSFAAVFFIIYGMTAVQGMIVGLKNRWIRAATGFIMVSCFAIAGTMPLTMHYFNQAAFLGLFSNCLLIPLIGFGAIPVALCGAFVHLVSSTAAGWFFTISGILVKAGLVVTEVIAGLPFAATKTITPNALEVFCYYGALWGILTLVGRQLGTSPKSESSQSGAVLGARPHGILLLARIPLALPVAVLGITLLVMTMDIGYWVNRRFFHDDLRITVLDVGQGNAAVVEIPGGKCMLIDGGGFAGSTTFDVGERIVAPFLWRNKIAHVDIIVLTHPDTDHVGGLAYITENFHVADVWETHEPKDTDEYRAFRQAVVESKAASPAFIDLPRTRMIRNVRFDILYPLANVGTKGGPPFQQSANNNSLVTRIAMGEVSFLFPGDIMAAAEAELSTMAGNQLQSTVLMAPHHGSKTSSTAVFLNRVRPSIVVVPAGWDNRYGYPHAPVLDRYRKMNADVYITGRHGAVILTTKGRRVNVETPFIRADS